jgi:hypothetical protein
MKPNMQRPPLKISEIPFHHVNLREDERKSIVCPDCSEWHLLRRGMVWPHHLERTERGKNGQRCPGSARRVEIDVDLAEWGCQIAEADATVAGRRATRVNRKPKVPVAPAVSMLEPAPLTAETVRQTYIAHRKRCAMCAGRAQCTDGDRLAVTYLRLLSQEPKRRRNRELFTQVQREIERKSARQFPRRRAAEWAAVIPAVKRADDQRARLPEGDAPTPGPSVPEQTLRVTV